MFTNVIFLILVLLLVSFAPLSNGNSWLSSPPQAFGTGLFVYLCLLAAIVLQNKIFNRLLRLKKQMFLTIVNLDLLGFLIYYHFILASHRFLPSYSFPQALFSLLLYFFGIYIFHRSAYPYLSNSLRGAVGSPSEYAMREIRLIAPFALPFLLFSLFVDAVSFFPNTELEKVLLHQTENVSGALLLFAVVGAFLTSMMVFFPPLVQKVWKCKPISNPELKKRLEALCERANFRHAGMKTWTIMNHSYTAGIIGIVPAFRYVMFTKRLLDEMANESIEAILAHEIGHSRRKHLLIYPVIIFGMIVATGLFSQFFAESINEFFRIHELLHPSPFWRALYPLALFIPYALIVALYFRFVFGYFSRLFERQADLHVFELGIPPEHMHQALDELGMLTGNSHSTPSWHHHSIHERMDFLQRAARDKGLVEKHHRRVKRNLIIYFFILTAFCCLAISPLLPQVAPFRQLNNISKYASREISDWINGSARKKLEGLNKHDNRT